MTRRCTAVWTPSSTRTNCWPGRSGGPPGCGAPTGAGSRWPARRTATRRWPSPSASRAGRSWSPGRCTARCCSASCWPAWSRCGCCPRWTPATGLPGPVPVSAVRDALARHPDTCAVFLGDPSYVGTTGDLAGHAAAAHEAGVPLLVNAAWAAHLGFHPGLPPHALAAGADAMVTSAHKVLPAYTQGALVLARTGRPEPPACDPARLDPARLDRAFEATHTTSPAGAIMASIDAARALLARDGEELCARLLAPSRRPGTGCARYRAWTCWTARASSRPSWSSCWPGPARTATRWRPTSSRRACRWRWPTGTRSSRSSPWPTTKPPWPASPPLSWPSSRRTAGRPGGRCRPRRGRSSRTWRCRRGRPFFAATKPAPPPGPWAG